MKLHIVILAALLAACGATPPALVSIPSADNAKAGDTLKLRNVCRTIYDVTPPTMRANALKDGSLIVYTGTVYADPGATVIDNLSGPGVQTQEFRSVGGNLTTGKLITTSPGRWIEYYYGADGAGNPCVKPAMRVIDVRARRDR